VVVCADHSQTNDRDSYLYSAVVLGGGESQGGESRLRTATESSGSGSYLYSAVAVAVAIL